LEKGAGKQVGFCKGMEITIDKLYLLLIDRKQIPCYKCGTNYNIIQISVDAERPDINRYIK
jgi:hypothetical protein